MSLSLLRLTGRALLIALTVLAQSLAAVPRGHAQAPDTGMKPPEVRAPEIRAPEIRIGDNVVLVPDRTARSITGWLIVLAGCADEADGQCVGIAHYLEHLLFINRDSENRSKVAMFADGSGNGWTTHRATAYFQRFPSRPATNAQSLDRLMAYFAGLLSEVRVTPEQAARERNVVLQEYHQNTGRNPFARFNVRINLALMPGEPLGQRAIGSPETINAFTTEAALAFHARWYARNNAYIVLHGPLDRDAVAPLVERHIAPLPAREIPPHAWKKPRAYETTRQELRAVEADARQAGAYLERIVSFEESAELRPRIQAAGEVLSSFLASRLPGSPLDVLMEREELVTGARLTVSRVRDGTLRLSFWGTPANGVAPERIIAAAGTYLADLARAGLPAETVERLKLRIRNERALLAEQPALYAQALTNWLSGHGTWEEWTARQSHAEAVTADHVAQLLAILAGPAREVAGVLLPGGGAVTSGVIRGGPDSAPPPLPSAQFTSEQPTGTREGH
jgi:zinc protease